MQVNFSKSLVFSNIFLLSQSLESASPDTLCITISRGINLWSSVRWERSRWWAAIGEGILLFLISSSEAAGTANG